MARLRMKRRSISSAKGGGLNTVSIRVGARRISRKIIVRLPKIKIPKFGDLTIGQYIAILGKPSTVDLAIPVYSFLSSRSFYSFDIQGTNTAPLNVSMAEFNSTRFNT